MHKEMLNSLGVPCETIGKLDIYVELLLKWNKKINLISKNTIPDIWIRHIVDSAQIIAFLKNRKESVVDIGTGAGLPGIILSILGVDNIILVESDERKTSFLQEISRILKLDVTILNDRVENINIKTDIVVSRGFSALEKIFEITKNIKYSRMLLLKGKNIEQEIVDANKNWDFFSTKHKSITSSDSYILDILNVRKREN